MNLQAGPIPTVSVDFSGFPNGDPGNAALLAEWDPLFASVELGMDALLIPGAIPDLNLPPDGNDADLATLDANLALFSGVDTQFDEGIGDAQVQDLAEKVIVAYHAIPGEAFQPVPAELSQNPLFPGVAQPSQSTATLSNLTRPGDTNFFPGDRYQIDVELAPQEGGGGAYAGVDVQLFSTLNGQYQDIQDLCLTDANGFLTAQGTFQVADVGDWAVTLAYYTTSGAGGIAGGGVAALNTYLNFTVQPLAGTPAPSGTSAILGGGLHPVQTHGQPCPSSTPLSATLVNTTRPGAQNFFSGDSWELTVTGPFDSDVLISAVFNGAPLPWVVIGLTDANGNFVLDGQTTDDYLGSWVESFQVGAQVWSGNLAFTVSPAAPAAPPATPPSA